MITCPYCGTQSPDSYPHCPNCGGMLAQPQAAPQPMPQQAWPGYIPPAAQPEPTTSLGTWFCWWLLLMFLPVIGTIIMLCTTRDPSAKNYAKLVLILQGVVVGFYVLMIVFSIAGGLAISRSYY